MKKRIVLLTLPVFLLTGCSLLTNILDKIKGQNTNENQEESEDQKEFAQTVTISEEEKGTPISSQQAQQTMNGINANMQSKMDEIQTEEGMKQQIENTDKFSYVFRNKVDDKIYIDNAVNYSRSDKYFHSKIITRTLMDDDQNDVHGLFCSDGDLFEYELGEQYVHAIKSHDWGYDTKNNENHDTSYAYYHYVTNYSFEQDVFTQLSELMLSVGNQGKNYMQTIDPYTNESMSNAYGSISFYSKGEGHLYGKILMPQSGITLEFLYENYWLKYEYMYTDLRQLQSFVGASFGLDSYTQMTTELYMDFQSAKVEYPNLDNYEYEGTN